MDFQNQSPSPSLSQSNGLGLQNEEVEYLLGIHDFRGRSEDELSLKKGDHIQVIETDKAFGDGWYIGRNLTTNEAGLFPKVFTTTLILPNRPAQETRSRNNSQSYLRRPSQQQQQQHPQELSPPPQLYSAAAMNTGSVHETLTDIDAAISEINGGVQQPQPQPQHKASTSNSSSVDIVQAPGMPSFDNIPEWTPFEVQRYFDARGYDTAVSEQFIHHKITGSILLELELAYLKEIDIASFGTRFEISKDIKHLNQIVKRQQGSPNVPVPSPASVRRQSMSHQYTRSPHSNIPQQQQQQPPTINARSSSLKSTSTNEPPSAEEYQKTRKPSFDRNWSHPGMKRTPSSGTSDSGFAGSNPQTPQLNDTVIPEDSTVAVAAANSPKQTKSNSISRSRSISSKRSSYVEDSRRRLHSRDASYDTIRAVEEREREQSVFDYNNDGTPHRSRSTSNVGHDFKFMRKRHSHSGSGSGLEILEDTSSKQHKRRSSLLSALMGSGSIHGGIGSQPSSPRQQTDSPASPVYQEYDEDDDEEDYEEAPTPLDSETQTATPDSSAATSLNSNPHQQHQKKNSMPDDKKSSQQTGFGKMKTLRQASSTHNLRRPLMKQNTSAFLEGIRSVNAQDSSKSADHSGWMNKRGGGVAVGSWKSRFFTLHGTRLSYFANFNDTKERGLIDITSHRVLPAKENEDKLVSLYAASVGAGRHVFKLVPPAPGTKKGVTFTAPKVHYFAVETKQELRQWMAALMKATIDRDESVPVISSCATPTVSLPKAQELFAEARARDEDLRSKMIQGGLSNMPNANAAAAAVAAKQQAANNAFSNNGTNGHTSDPDSPGSSLRSSQTGSSATNSSSLKVVSSSNSPKDYSLNLLPPLSTSNNDSNLRHLTTKTAGLKIVTDLENS